MPLDLVVPDLLLPEEAPGEMRRLRLPALESWLARAEARRMPQRGMTASLAAAFGLDEPWPVAAVTLAADDRPREGTWLRADPVHLRIEQDAVALQGAAALDVSVDEARILGAALQDFFAADGLEFVVPTAERWYVSVPAAEVPRTVPISEALGRNVFGLLPRGSGRMNWHAAITEAQMLLTGHAVNERREREGRPAINSVWFWGEGETPGAVASPYALVCASEAFAAGLGRLSGTRTIAVPAGFDAIDAVRADESVLVVLDTLGVPWARGDAAGWTSAAAELDRRWFAEIDRALRRFERVSLVLPGPNDTLVATVTPASRWRWFRGRKPLASHA